MTGEVSLNAGTEHRATRFVLNLSTKVTNPSISPKIGGGISHITHMLKNIINITNKHLN